MAANQNHENAQLQLALILLDKDKNINELTETDVGLRYDSNLCDIPSNEVLDNKEKDAVVVYIDKPSSKYRKSYKELVKKMNGLSAIVFLRKKTNQQNLIVKSKDVYSKPFSYRKTTKI